jgi:type I restriction enzyme S subunit
MELIKKGYQQTEIGVIPKDWKVVELEHLASKIGSGITPKGGSTVYKEAGRPLVRSQNVGWGKLLLDDIAFIDDEIHQTFPNTEIKLNDVFLNISGASIGRSSFANETLVGGNVNQHVCIIRPFKNKLNYTFLNKFLLSKGGQKQIDSFQSGGNREGLNIGQIRTFKIPLPPLPEQKAIAEVLSDMDNLITALERQIEKKRLVKQGAMQRLLTAGEDWEVRTLGEVMIDMLQGINTAIDVPEYVADGIPILKANNIIDGTVNWKTSDSISLKTYQSYSERFKLKKGDFLFSNIGARLGTGSLLRDDIECSFAWNVMRMIPNKSIIEPEYINSALNSKEFNKKVLASQTGSGMGFVPKNILKNMDISFPSLSEQTRIATILSDMDGAVESLEKQLEKYRAVKVGLMQELLSGRKRLIDNRDT